MKRLLICVALAVALVIAGSGLKDHRIPAGNWNGTTTQGLPIEFLVADTADGSAIVEWRLSLDLACERTGRVVHAGVVSSVPVKLVDDSIFLDLRFLTFWNRWIGSFLSNDEAQGEFVAVWAALSGSDIGALATEKCKVLGLRWTARFGSSPTTQRAHLDLLLHIENDSDGNLVTRVTASSGSALTRHEAP